MNPSDLTALPKPVKDEMIPNSTTSKESQDTGTGRYASGTGIFSQTFWTATYNTDKFSDDKLTRAAVAAAAYEAVTSLEGVDSFIVTRVITTGRGPDAVCAKVFGRGLRLKKYEPKKPEDEQTAQPAQPDRKSVV